MNIRNGIDTAENQLNDAEDKLYFSMNADEIDLKKWGKGSWYGEQKQILGKQHSEERDQNKRRNKGIYREENLPELKSSQPASSSQSYELWIKELNIFQGKLLIDYHILAPFS